LATANGARVVFAEFQVQILIAPVIFDDLHFQLPSLSAVCCLWTIEDGERFIRGGGYAPLDGLTEFL